MKILLRNDKREAWKLVESAAYKGESELQHLLADSPSLISIDDVRAGAGQLVLAIREFPLPIGSLDLLAFSANGDMAVIECKLASNPEIKRKVIGQALEYGAHLWQMSYEEIDQKIKERKGKSLAELMHVALGEDEWDEEAFRTNVESTLENGSFILMIVVDEITEELSRIIHFVNNCGRPAFTFAALEMQRYQSEQTEMLVPRVVGDTSTPTTNNGGRRIRWTEELFFKAAAEKVDKATYQTIKCFYDWSEKHSFYTRFGTGSAEGSYTFVLDKNGVKGSVFSVYTDGRMTINFGYMEKIFSAEEIDTFRKELSSISTIRDISGSPNYYYYLDIASAFPKQENIEQFQQKVLNLKKLLQ